jgi:tRNA (guanine26-N2/guanine27-N2)-dimethyltransferase
MHETGLRIYLKEVFENYARYDKCFDPKFCWHEQHYTRVMGRVTESKKRTNRSLDNIGYLSFCPECRWRKLERKDRCENCGSEDIEIATTRPELLSACGAVAVEPDEEWAGP